MALILCGVAFVFAVVAVAWLYRKDRPKRADALVNLLVTLSATYVGVYLAVFANDRSTEHSEREQVKALLQQVHDEAANDRTQQQVFLQILQAMPERDHKQHLDDNPRTELVTLDYLLSNELAAKHAQLVCAKLLHERKNLKYMVTTINTPAEKVGNRVLSVKLYIAELEHVRGLLANGMAYVKGEIDDSEFEARADALAHRKVFGK